MKKFFKVALISFICFISGCQNVHSSSISSSSSSSSLTKYEDIKFMMELYGKEGTQSLINKINNKESFIVVFEGTTCHFCKNFNEKVLNVFLNSAQGREYQDDIFYYFSTDFISEIYSLSLANNLDKAKEYASFYENELILPYYKPAFEEFEGYEYTSKVDLGNEIVFYAAETPTTLYFANGEVVGFLYGDISDANNYLLRFSETINAWEKGKNNLDEGKEAFHNVLSALYN